MANRRGRPRDLAPRRPPPARDRDADRALFEQALERLGPADHEEKHGASEGKGPLERSARFAKRVARGEIEPAATVDLHGLDRDSATATLRRFLSSSPGEAVLVIHGRGRGIVEAAALAELDRHPRVAEHLPAPRAMGGAGARLIRLRS